jgi:hypothetical protein
LKDRRVRAGTVHCWRTLTCPFRSVTVGPGPTWFGRLFNEGGIEADSAFRKD